VTAQLPRYLVDAFPGLHQSVNLVTLSLGHAFVRHFCLLPVSHMKEVYFNAWPLSKL